LARKLSKGPLFVVVMSVDLIRHRRDQDGIAGVEGEQILQTTG